MILGVIIPYIYNIFVKHNIVIKMPDGVPPQIANGFSAIIPAASITVVVMAIRQLCTLTSFGTLNDLIYGLLRAPLGALSASPITFVILLVFCNLLWFFGIHGGMVTMAFLSMLYMTPALENLEAYAALAYLEERSRQPDAKPFFLYCTLSFPHPPYGCEEPWYSLIDRDKLPPRRPDVETLEGKAEILRDIRAKQDLQNWEEKQYNEVRAVYLGMVARFDHQLGLVREKLKETGVYDDTSIFVFSDHGDLTGDYGIEEKCQNSFEDPLTNVPLVVKPAAGTPVCRGRNPALVQLLDLPATVYEMAGVTPDYIQFGQSLCQTIATGGAHRDAVFCEGGRIKGETQAMEPLHGPESPYWPRISTQHESDAAHTKGCMIRMGQLKYILRLYEADQLYDLEKDPMELHNCIDDPAYAQPLAEMKNRMLRFYMETGDFVPSQMDKR